MLFKDKYYSLWSQKSNVLNIDMVLKRNFDNYYFLGQICTYHFHISILNIYRSIDSQSLPNLTTHILNITFLERESSS